jgi:predicted N-acetyltransferase YhbS
LAFTAVHVASWQVAYRNIVPNRYLHALDVAERVSRYIFDTTAPQGPVTFIATEGESVVGMVALSACRNEDLSNSGEVQALYVTPTKWRSGVGTVLMSKGEQLLVANGFTTACL